MKDSRLFCTIIICGFMLIAAKSVDINVYVVVHEDIVSSKELKVLNIDDLKGDE